jgi:hypothetical protein
MTGLTSLPNERTQVVAPKRADPAQLDSFISTQLSDEDREAVAAKIRDVRRPPAP